MLVKIFDKFIALLVLAIVAYLGITLYVIFPKINNFFYETEKEHLQTQLQRVSDIVLVKSLYLKDFEEINHEKSQREIEKSSIENFLKLSIKNTHILNTGFFYVVKNSEVILNKNRLSPIIYEKKGFAQKLQKASSSQEPILSEINGKDKYELIAYNDYFDWYIVLCVNKEELYVKAEKLNNMILNITFIILGLVLVCGYILAKRLLSPINELSLNALKVRSGDFKVRSKIYSKDEIGLLAKQFNFMLDTIESNIENLEREVKSRTEELSKKLLIDDVTQLKNRTALIDNIYKKATTVILIDINAFNDINELYGYKVGNEVLFKFGQFLSQISKENDSEAYKIYGNVFAILSNSELIQFDKFENFLQELIANTKKEPITIESLDINIYVDITVGVAICQEQALKKANIALQKAKKKHRHYVVYNSEIDRKQIIQDTIFWRNKIEDAIDNDKIIPFSQPIVNADKEIVKYEMLMRMEDIHNDEVTYISPFKFLDISVKTKQYLALSNIMIDKSLDLIDKTDKLLSINISFLDIDDINFIHFLDKKINAIDKKYYPRIVFEILESDNISQYDIFDEFIEKYRSKGIKIAIDDFGTGYSNFKHIMKIRPDYLKIDASLIRDIDINKDSYELVKSIVVFSKELKIKTVAEFVHSQEVYELARDLGIDEFQGYYFGKPEKEFK